MFIVSSKIGVHEILCNNTDTEARVSLCESIISMARRVALFSPGMAETNGRLEYWIWDSELKQTDVMVGGGGYLLCWGTQACAIFLGILFA